MLSCCAFKMARSAFLGRGFLRGFLCTGVSILLLLFDEFEGVEVEFPDDGAESSCFFFLAFFLRGFVGGGVGSFATPASNSSSESESESEESDSTWAGDSSTASAFRFEFISFDNSSNRMCALARSFASRSARWRSYFSLPTFGCQ